MLTFFCRHERHLTKPNTKNKNMSLIIAKNKVEYHLEHRFQAMLKSIAKANKPATLGKKLFDLAKDTGPAMHRTGKEGRPKFTSAQWAKIWEAYRVRVPKAMPTEQIPMFEPPAF
jgi:hypothetical protein